MSTPQSHDGDEPTTEDGAINGMPTTGVLAGAVRRLRANPRTLGALLLTGIVVMGIDWLHLQDPIPSVEYMGLLDGRFSLLFGLPITVFPRETAPLSTFVDLQPQWLVWAVGLELLGFVVVVGAGAYALARLLRIPLTRAATVRYTGLVALFQLGAGVRIRGNGPTTLLSLESIPFGVRMEGTGLLLSLLVFVSWMFVLVRLFALPGYLVAGESVEPAVRQSWQNAIGHGWSLFGVIVFLGLLNHLLTSVPVAGPLGTALVAGLHAGTVATFLDR